MKQYQLSTDDLKMKLEMRQHKPLTAYRGDVNLVSPRNRNPPPSAERQARASASRTTMVGPWLKSLRLVCVCPL